MRIKQGRSVIAYLEISLSTTTSMKRSRRELSTDVIFLKDIFKKNQTKPFPYFNFIAQTGKGSTTVKTKPPF